jgi:hypothetical protein
MKSICLKSWEKVTGTSGISKGVTMSARVQELQKNPKQRLSGGFIS